MEDHPDIFMAQFGEGYSFRNLITLLKAEIDQLNLIFSDDGITAQQESRNNSGVYSFTIRGSDLSKYNYSAYDGMTGQKIPMISVGIDLKELLDSAKAIRRNDGVVISMYPGENRIRFRPIPCNTKEMQRCSVSFVNTIPVPIHSYDYPKFKRNETESNWKISPKDLSSVFSSMATLKCSHVVISCYPSGISFKGISTTQVVVKVETFGTCQESTGEQSAISTEFLDYLRNGLTIDNSQYKQLELVIVDDNDNTPCVRIPLKTIKAFAKIGNIVSGQALVKLSGEIFQIVPKPGEPPKNTSVIRIICGIGSYGMLSIILRNT
jgi:hypothetical protein